MMTWRADIENAPKDTNILGYVPDADDFYGPILIIRSDSDDEYGEWWNYRGDDTTRVSPTHWQPLPEPPVCNASDPEYATPLQHPDKDAR